MANYIGQRRVGVFLAIGAQHRRGVVQSGKTLALADRIKLTVGQVAGDRGEGVCVGMAGDKRLIAQFGHIPETFFGDMRQVDQNALGVARFDQTLACLGQARASIGAHRIGEWNTVSENVVAAPHRSE